MFDLGTIIVRLLIPIVIVIGVILIIREIVMWYWKINIIVENLEEQKKLINLQNRLLKSIKDELQYSHSKTNDVTET